MPALTPANDLVRARNVSASEVYALLGHHPYSSPTKIFDRLMTPAMDTHQQSEAMAIGSFMEPYVARYAARKLGLRVRAATRSVEYKGKLYRPVTGEYVGVNLCATPDYYVLGQRMLMEVKVSSILYGWNEDDIHPHYEYQARAQMACTNRDVCIIVALVGSAFFHIPIVRDLQKEEVMLRAVDNFWYSHVMTGIRPEVTETPRVAKITVTRS
jgi:predicted phage-related endonuclease